MSILSLLMASACKGDDTTPGGGPGGSSCQVEPLGSLEVDQELERNIGDLLTKFTSLARRVELLAFDQDGSKFNILDGISEIGLTGEAVGVVDGPAGVISPAGASAVSRATIFPAPLLMTASWDTELMNEVGQAMAAETQDNEKKVLLAPGINLYRIPHNGRNFEYYGEDPYLISQSAVAFIKGVQAQGVISTPKHYCCNNSEFDRNWASSNMDNRTLHEIYLPAYRASLREAGVWSFMSAYNPVAGTPATENREILIDILRDKWEFRGFVMSDWLSIRSPQALANGTHLEMPNLAQFSSGNINTEITAGRASEVDVLDAMARVLRSILGSNVATYQAADQTIELTGYGSADFRANDELALRAARSGIVLLKNEENALPMPRNNTVKIHVIGNQGLIDSTPRLGTGSANVRPEGNTLLNDPVDNNIEALMLATFTAGGGTSANLTFEKLAGGNGAVNALTGDAADLTSSQKTAINASAYVVIPLGYGTDGMGGFFAGGNEGENKERPYTLPAGQDNLLRRVVAAVAADTDGTKAKIIVTLTAGGGVDMSAWHGDVDAIVHSFYLGQSVQALPEILFGAVNPSGKLPITIEEERKDSSTYNSYELNTDPSSKSGSNVDDLIRDAHNRSRMGNQVGPGTNTQYALEYGEGIFVGYRHFDRYLNGDGVKNQYLESNGEAKYYPDSSPVQNDNTTNPTYARDLAPLYAFGHGLSYSSFAYSNLQIAKGANTPPLCRDTLRISLDVGNTSSLDGSEVVQLYVRDVEWDEAYPRPYKELKGYARVALDANETKRAVIEIPADVFAYYKEAVGTDIGSAGEWVIDDGEFELLVGTSSTSISLRKTVNVSVDGANVTVTVDNNPIVLGNVDLN